jgi:hypothetical protein
MENLSYINYKKFGKCEHVMKQNIHLASGHVKNQNGNAAVLGVVISF